MTGNSTRIQFVDQLRGLSMVMVVMNHLLQFAFGIKGSILSVVFETIDLPLFFFISGYFFYKNLRFSLKETGRQIIAKTRAYLLPLLSVGTLYFVFTNYSFQHLIISGGGKLWFLYTLFWLSCICIIIAYPPIPFWFLQTKIRCFTWDIIVYVAIYVLIIVLKNLYPDVKGWLPLGQLTTYYRYFVIGLMVRKYDMLENLLNKSTILFTISVLCLVIGCYFHKYNNMLLSFLSALGGIFSLWYFFSNMKDRNKIADTFGLIGKHTLAIYLFHYFFIPDLYFLQRFMMVENPIIPQLAASVLCSALIIPICIFIEKFLNKSKFLSFLLLGKKIK